ncbi:MAG: hypothetical protein K0B09_08825 [Bacteroidales bacterium]|nr:hypothetical protein [Bacteroidales bacterium]
MRLNQRMFSLVFLLFLAGCYYDAYVMPDNPEITTDVSFSKDIIPIFNQSCNSSGCHNMGGTAPDLTPTNAYNALKSGNYINTSSPENSELYQWMNGQRSLPMPLSGPNQNYNAYVLAWIKQGALNN